MNSKLETRNFELLTQSFNLWANLYRSQMTFGVPRNPRSVAVLTKALRRYNRRVEAYKSRM